MDNLTHSLTGALLAQAGLKRLTGRATATLIIAANIPDIDAFATVLGTESLAIRRGITHGPVALLLLPLALTGLILAWERWRPNKPEQPVRPASVLILAYVGTLSHPALDYLNSYGIRLLEPFSSRWFYGDTLFIIDVWVWSILIVGYFVSRRLERRTGRHWNVPAIASFAAIGAYIASNGLITSRAEAETRRVTGAPPTVQIVANPVPISFWIRRMLLRDDHWYSLGGEYHLQRGVTLSTQINPLRLDHPALTAARGRPDVEAFLFWSRMPIVVEQGGRAYLTDQRFAGRAFPIGDEEGTSFRYDPFTVPLGSGDRR